MKASRTSDSCEAVASPEVISDASNCVSAVGFCTEPEIFVGRSVFAQLFYHLLKLVLLFSACGSKIDLALASRKGCQGQDSEKQQDDSSSHFKSACKKKTF